MPRSYTYAIVPGTIMTPDGRASDALYRFYGASARNFFVHDHRQSQAQPISRAEVMKRFRLSDFERPTKCYRGLEDRDFIASKPYTLPQEDES